MYTTIIHPLRKAYNLSITEYCILDSIYMLSHNSKYGGWCIASKRQIAEELDLAERTVFNAIETLTAKDLIEKSDNGNLKTKDEWNELIANKHDYAIAFNGKEQQLISGVFSQKPLVEAPQPSANQHFAEPMQKMQSGMQKLQTPMQKMQNDSAKIADNIYKYNNNNNNNDNKREATPSQKMQEFIISIREKDELYSALSEKLSSEKKLSVDYVGSELTKFVDYWTELNKSGTKERWELQPAFEVQRRLTTWFGKMNNFNDKSKFPKTISV